MKFLMLSNDDPETLRTPPTPEKMAAIGAFMVDAERSGAIYLTGGIQPGECGVTVTLEAGQRTVTDGPYAESKELVAGFAIVDVASRDEAIEWATRFATAAGVQHVEIRQVFLREDFPEAPGSDAG
jgi:hypothetical protein